MFEQKKPKARRPVTCPHCSAQQVLTDGDFAWYFLTYRPYVCQRCKCRFGPNHLVRWIYLVLGSLPILMALHIQDIRALSKEIPELKMLLTGGITLLFILGAALLVKFNKMIVVPEKKTPLDVVLHFASHYILPFSLVFFWFVARAGRESGM